jgi:hypothetical protein
MIHVLSWSHNLTETEAVKESIRQPSIDTIRQRLRQLDSDAYPSLTLYANPSGKDCPHMAIYGGPEGYAVWLSVAEPTGDCGAGLITFIDPQKRAAHLSGYRVIGRTYPGVATSTPLGPPRLGRRQGLGSSPRLMKEPVVPTRSFESRAGILPLLLRTLLRPVATTTGSVIWGRPVVRI